MACDDGHEAVDPRLPDRGRDVGPVDVDAATVVELDGVLRGQLCQLWATVEREFLAQRKPGERAVHRAGVEIAEAKPARERARDSALPRSGGAVDGDDHVISPHSRGSAASRIRDAQNP